MADRAESIDSLEEVQEAVDRIRTEVAKRIVGQRTVVDEVLACVLCDGNALLESNPGLAKTLLVRTLADVTDLEFSRIQNTPDLMPSDIVGTRIIQETEAGMEFEFEPGPVFANVVLADEINRATPKTQSALLEAMQERQVTAGGSTHRLPEPFFLLATQNPIDQEGSLHPDESLYMDGRLWRAGDAIEHARANGELVHEGGRTKLYDVGATTQTLTEDGSMQETDCLVYETDYEGKVYTIETKTGRTIRVSDNHPFLVNRDGVIQWTEARDLDTDDFLVSAQQLDLPERPLPSHETALYTLSNEGHVVVRRDRVRELKRKLERQGSLSSGEIDTLRIAARLTKKELATRVEASYDRVLNFLGGVSNGVGDQLRAALLQTNIDLGDYVESLKVHRIDDEFTEEDAGFFIGFILAEGSVTDTTAEISQKNIPDAFDKWVSVAERVGLDVSVRERPSGRHACIHSKPFIDYLDARYFLRTPERILSAPKPFREAFLEIVLLTESHFDADRRRITFVQRDRKLTNLIAHLLLDVGIIPWLYNRGRRFEIRIQGEDVATYTEQFAWRGTTPNVSEFKSAHRTTPLPVSKVTRLVDLLGMKHDEPLSERGWYTSYRWLRTKRSRMATPYFERLLDDVETTLARREAIDIDAAVEENVGTAAKSCGLSMMDIVANTSLTKHRVWKAYTTDERPAEAVEYVVGAFTERMAEAEELTRHLRGLVDVDVFYDRVTAVEREPYDGPVIGLSVPETHTYLAGMGACGINHNTYPLPEAQADRFTMKILVDYPSFDEEREVVERFTKRVDQHIPVDRVVSRDELRDLQELTRQVPIADDLLDAAIDLVQRTRSAPDVEFGASPRASMALVVAAKARALLEGRAHVSHDDLQAMAPPVLRHRLILSFSAEREGKTPDDVVGELLE